MRWVLLLVLVGCDGDGCNGGPNGPASKFCQGEIERLAVPVENQANVCKSCCLQEVPYKGTIEKGKCVCNR